MAKAISSQLHDQRMGAIFAHYSLHNFFEKFIKSIIWDARLERNIERVVFAFVLANFINIASAREEILPILMKRNRHDPVREEESFLNSISMMDINVKVKDSRVNLQQLQNTNNNIIYIAKSTCLRFFCMMKPACPINGNISVSIENQTCSIYWGSSRNLADIIQPIKRGAVCWLANLKSLALCKKVNLLLGISWIQETIHAATQVWSIICIKGWRSNCRIFIDYFFADILL